MPILNSRLQVRAKDQQGDPIPGPSGMGLRRFGPRILITLSPLEAQIKTFVEQGESLPTPVVGLALIDTGASATCIDRNAAERAGLELSVR